MSLQIADNFSYKGRKPLDARLVCNDIPDMLALPTSTIYDGIIVYVVAQKKFYTYDSNNTVDPTLQQWRELTTAGILIQSATIDNVTTSATKGHLILTMSDGTTIDCGDAKGDKGDKGDGFAIIKLYTNVSDMTSDTNPVNDGQMVAIINSSTTPLTAKVYIRNSSQTQDASGNENGYTFFCNLADATIIQGPQGPQGPQGVKGDTPVVTTQAIAATSTTPSGTKITFTTGTGSTAVSTSINVYNGKDGISVQSATINASGELVFTLSDASTINVGKIGGNGTGGCITMLGCFDTAPTTFAQNDIYYNNLDGLIYKSADGTTWGTGSQPEKDILYISMDDHKIYSYTNNTFEVYGGGIIDISSKANNAIKNITGSTIASEDGLYVEDLKTEINKLNYAQKTVNDIGSVSLLDTPYLFTTTPAKTMGNASNNRLEHDLILNESISNYDEIQILISMGDPNDSATYVKRVAQPCTFKVRSIEFNPSSDSADYSNAYATLVCENTTPSSVAGTYGNVKFTLICWFKDDKTLHLHTLYNPHTSTKCSSFMIDNILGIKEKTIIVDPVEYVDSTKGIEDTPVGSVISYSGINIPKHYLPCDGGIYNITDYPHLAEFFKDNYGGANVFGGDGITTFGVPTRDVKINKIDLVPEMTSNSQGGYVLTSSSIWDANYVPYQAFDKNKHPLYDSSFATAGGTTTGWIQVEFPQKEIVTEFSLQARAKAPASSITNFIDFQLLGSNDGTNFNTLFSITDEPAWYAGEIREYELTSKNRYKYYRLNVSKSSGPHYVDIQEIGLFKIIKEQYIIKAEPTYFMHLEGVEVTEDLLTDKSFDITTNGVTTIDKSFTLPTPITDFDEIETVYSYEKAEVVVKDSVSGTVATATELTPTSNYKGLNFPGTSTSGITYSTISGLTYPLTVEIAFSTTSTKKFIFVHDVKLGLAVGVVDGYLQLATSTNTSIANMSYHISNLNLADGNFHTITVTYNSANSANLYFDGVLKSSTTYSNAWDMSNVSSIGNRFNYPYDGPYKGILYAVRFYNGILSQSDIVASYNSDKNYVLNNTAQIARNNLACEYKLYDSVEIIHPYITSSKLSVRDIEYNSVLSVDKSVQNVTNNKAAYTELQYTFTDKNNVKFLNVSNHYNDYLPGSKFGIRRLTGIRKISK